MCVAHIMQGKGVVDATKEEILDSFKTKCMALELAMEAALTILRVDQVPVACTEFSSPLLPPGSFTFFLLLLLPSRSCFVAVHNTHRSSWPSGLEAPNPGVVPEVIGTTLTTCSG